MYGIGIVPVTMLYAVGTLSPIAVIVIAGLAFGAGYFAIEIVYRQERRRRALDEARYSRIGTRRRCRGSWSIDWIYAGLLGGSFALRAGDGIAFHFLTKPADAPSIAGSELPARIGIGLLIPMAIAIFFVPIHRSSKQLAASPELPH